MGSAKSDTRVTVPALLARKSPTMNSNKITALTAYDYTMAVLLDRAEIDVLLVGDSLANVVQGRDTTLPVTLEQMVYHCSCVSRGTKRALVVGDLPFLSYQTSPRDAIRSAGALIKDGGVGAVKLEGGVPMAETIARLVEIDIPVMGHIGLTPQSYHRMGGYRVQGKGTFASQTAERIMQDARAVEQAGAFSIVIEGVPSDLAAEITAELCIPTIGIGAGSECDGQILVSTDMLGLNTGFVPKFVKQFVALGEEVVAAAGAFKAEVEQGSFPSVEHSFAAAQPPVDRHLRMMK